VGSGEERTATKQGAKGIENNEGQDLDCGIAVAGASVYLVMLSLSGDSITRYRFIQDFE
jgi:hypothetical protein